jgi:hypothetical protein
MKKNTKKQSSDRTEPVTSKGREDGQSSRGEKIQSIEQRTW